MVAKIEEEMKRLRCVKDNLTEQLERLHNHRFGILEELVYQRWLNSSLRFELQDCHSPHPKTIRPNVFRRLDSQSEDGSKLTSMDPIFDRTTSETSSADSDEITDTTGDNSSSSSSAKNKKSGLIHNMRRWGRRKDDSNANAKINSLREKAGLFRRFSMSSVSSRTSVQRNKRDTTTTIPIRNEARDSNSPDTPPTPRVRRVSFNDSLNTVAYTYDDMPISDLGISPNNDPDAAESSSDFSDRKGCSGSGNILQEEEAEMASAQADLALLNGSRDLNNQNIDNGKIESEAARRTEIVHEESLSSGMPNMVPEASKSGHDQMVQFIVAIIVILVLLFISRFCLLKV